MHTLWGRIKPHPGLQRSCVIPACCKLLPTTPQCPLGRQAEAPVSEAGTARAAGGCVVFLPERLPSGCTSRSFNKTHQSLQIRALGALIKLIARPSPRKNALLSRQQIKRVCFSRHIMECPNRFLTQNYHWKNPSKS